MAKELDKADFLHTGYPVDKDTYPGGSSGRAKRPRWDTTYLQSQRTTQDKSIKIDSEDDVDEDDTGDLPLSQNPTPRTAMASSGLPTDSDLRGSCDTSAPCMETPNSSLRVRGKKKIADLDDPNLALVKLVTSMS